MARRYEQAIHRGGNMNGELTYKVSLVIKEMENETTMRYHLIPRLLAYISRLDNAQYW